MYNEIISVMIFLCFSHIRGWQPSPDGSSTDSELEEIFGDSFKFSRPKNLVIGNSSHDGLSIHKVRQMRKSCRFLSHLKLDIRIYLA